MQRWNTLLDTLYKHYISKILRIFSEDLPWNCLSGTHSPVFHLQTCANSLTLRESYLLVVWTTECVRTVTHKMTQPERILSASPLCVHVNGAGGRQKGCVPTLSTWVRLKIQQRTSLLSGLTALTQSLLSAPFHSDTLIQLHITWLLLYLILIKRAGVYLSRPCHPCKGIN